MELQAHLIAENLRSAGWFRPELCLTFGSIGVFVLDLFWRKSPARVALLTAATLVALALSAGFLWVQPATPQSLFNGLLANDAFASFFKWLFLAAASLTVLIAAQGREFPPVRIGEFYALLLAIELVSMVSYVLSGYRKGDRKASEASLKYVIYGGVASGVMVFGMSWLYGLLGTTSVLEFAQRLQALPQGGAVRVALVLAVVFVSAGIGYKVAAVPWHMWCPDVYEGAPTPFTAFLSVGPKAAGFALAIRFFFGAFAGPAAADGFAEEIGGIPWPAVIGVLAAVTMTLGNFTAIVQTNLKRLLAYSSIAHAGYTRMGLSAVSQTGAQGVMLYMLVYLVMNLGAFLVVILVAQSTGSESILDYRGLARRQPLAAVAFAIFLFSLTGIPPFAGFAGKWYLFMAVIERIGGPGGGWYAALAIIGALNTAVSLYYYARIIRAMFIDPAEATAAPVPAKAGYN